MLKTGLKHTSTAVVIKDVMASSMGSGDMDVFATPAMVALMENAAMNAVAGALPEGSGTVGTFIEVSHIKASGPGKKVSATAELVEIDGRKLTFNVTASDDDGVIGEGRHVRAIVDRQKFLSRL